MITSKDNGLNELMNGSIRELLEQAWKVLLHSPKTAAFILRSIRAQSKAAKLRGKWEAEGVHVPPFIIASITNRCNLRCKGCYAAAQHRETEGEITEERFSKLLDECEELGISFALLAGGEPMVRRELLKKAAEHPNMIFPIFTNGLLIRDETLDLIKGAKNLIPVISLEGGPSLTDDRRGLGVYGYVSSIMKELSDSSVFYGTSITVTKENLDEVTNPSFVSEISARGCKLFFYVEYVAADEAAEGSALDEEGRKLLMGRLAGLRAVYPALFIAFPGDEEAAGGCLAAGRGFVHIGARGEVEPCPFTPWSDTSLTRISLLDALKSPFLAAIREHHGELTELSGGCALWSRREWVQELLAEVGNNGLTEGAASAE